MRIILVCAVMRCTWMTNLIYIVEILFLFFLKLWIFRKCDSLLGAMRPWIWEINPSYAIEIITCYWNKYLNITWCDELKMKNNQCDESERLKKKCYVNAGRWNCQIKFNCWICRAMRLHRYFTENFWEINWWINLNVDSRAMSLWIEFCEITERWDWWSDCETIIMQRNETAYWMNFWILNPSVLRAWMKCWWWEAKSFLMNYFENPW